MEQKHKIMTPFKVPLRRLSVKLTVSTTIEFHLANNARLYTLHHCEDVYTDWEDVLPVSFENKEKPDL
jgi:hypothetical protein